LGSQYELVSATTQDGISLSKKQPKKWIVQRMLEMHRYKAERISNENR